MPTSIQTLGERVEILNDLDLFAVMAFVNEAVDREQGKFDSLMPYLVNWQQCCIEYGPGTIDLGIEEISANASAKSDLERVLSDVEHKLDEIGDTITPEFLGRWCRVRGVRFHAFPTNNVVRAIDRIRALLA